MVVVNRVIGGSMTQSEEYLWKHIAQLRPRLRKHVGLYPQDYRGTHWYVLHDQSADNYIRFNACSYAILGRLDGDRTLEEILEQANESETDCDLTESSVVHLIAQLNAAEVLRDGLPINAEDVLMHYHSQQRQKQQRALMNPFAIRLPIFNPEALLDFLEPVARWIFSRLGIWIWAATILLALILGFVHFDELKSEISGISLSPSQLLIFWLLYPVIKAMHELGHGLVIKRFGGRVNQMGVNLLVFMPIPYVDATASWLFRNKWRRVFVALSGMYVELFLAAISLFFWLLLEPGFVKELALNVVLIAAVSTVLFNGNPLLKYDGYYALEDAIEIPNLAKRSSQYYYYLIQKYLLGLKLAHSPVSAEGEKGWFIFYGILSPIYRFTILFTIALYLAGSYLVIGVVMAIWIVVLQLIMPLIKGVRFILNHLHESDKPRKTYFGLIGLVAIFTAIFFIPLPLVTYTQGVVTVEGDADVIAPVSGFIQTEFESCGEMVKKGAVLVQLSAPDLMTRKTLLKSQESELQVKLYAEQGLSRVHKRMLQDDLDAIKSELRVVDEQIESLTLYSKLDGSFVTEGACQNREGLFVVKGEKLGHIVNFDKMVVRAVVPQPRIGLLDTHKTAIEIVIENGAIKIVPVELLRQTPKATTHLPSAALGTASGGTNEVEPFDESGTKVKVPVFIVDFKLPKSEENLYLGKRVPVRLNHGSASLGFQLGLYFQQLFLRYFSVKS